MKKGSKRASLRVDLNLDNEDEAACYELWLSGFRACPGVTVSGKALFVHAIARLNEELQRERVGAVSAKGVEKKGEEDKEEDKDDEKPASKMNLAVFD